MVKYIIQCAQDIQDDKDNVDVVVDDVDDGGRDFNAVKFPFHCIETGSDADNLQLTAFR